MGRAEIEDGSEAHHIDADFATSIEDMGSEQKDLPKMTFLVAGTAKGHLVLTISTGTEKYTHFIAHKDPITGRWIIEIVTDLYGQR